MQAGTGTSLHVTSSHLISERQLANARANNACMDSGVEKERARLSRTSWYQKDIDQGVGKTCKSICHPLYIIIAPIHISSSPSGNSATRLPPVINSGGFQAQAGLTCNTASTWPHLELRDSRAGTHPPHEPPLAVGAVRKVRAIFLGQPHQLPLHTLVHGCLRHLRAFRGNADLQADREDWRMGGWGESRRKGKTHIASLHCSCTHCFSPHTLVKMGPEASPEVIPTCNTAGRTAQDRLQG